MRKLSGLPAILLLFSLLLTTGSSLAQDNDASDILARKVSYKAEKYSLNRVLKDLRKQMNIRFTYNDEHIREQPPVTVNLQSVPFETLLKEILKSTDLSYTVAFGGVILAKKEKVAAAVNIQNPKEMHMVLRGQVVSPSGVPLAGVSIRALESGAMTVTQSDGIFMLMPRENEQVRFSLMGMKPLVYKAVRTEQEMVQLKMDTVVQAIQEVVVNGYQKIDPRLATGSVMKLSAAEVLQPGVPSIDKMLQGKVPGLMIINTSGSVNSSPKMRMRGTSTLLGNAAPLWVIDGMILPDPVDISSAVLNNMIGSSSKSNFEMMGNAISGVNPYDIESLTFLRDAAATAIYGTRAANGVIVITTKRGKEGPVRITYNTDFSFQQRPSYRKMNLMNSKERVELSRQLIADQVVYSPKTSGFDEYLSYEGLQQALYAGKITEEEFGRQVGVLETRNTDWFKELFRNEFSLNHSLSLSGGNDRTTYYASVMYGDNKSAAKEDGAKNYSASIKLNSQINKKLSLDVTLTSNYRKARSYHSSVNPQRYALQTSRLFSPDAFIPAATGIMASAPPEFVGLRPPMMYNIHNEIAHSSNTTSSRSATLNLNIDYKILRGLYFRNSSNVITYASEGLAYIDHNTFAIAQLRGWGLAYTPTPLDISNSTLPAGGIANTNSINNTTFGMRNSLDYSTGLFENRDQFNVSLGNEIRSEIGDNRFSTQPGFYPDRGNIFSPTARGLYYLSSNGIDLTKKNTLSMYGTIAYSLMNRYIISGTIRTDGSNRFGQYANSRFLPNYSISGRWNAAMESWFPRGMFISDWQVRASFGTQGNVVSSVSPNLIAKYNPNKLNPTNNMPYLTIKSLPYPDLRWEKTYQWNIGTSLAMLNNRLKMELEVYSKKTVDVVDMLPIPLEYGMEIMYRNGSTMYNKGIELALTAHLISNKNTQLSLSLNTSKNLNRLSDQVSTFNYFNFFTGTGNLPGKAVSGIYSYKFKGLNHNTGRPEFSNLDLPAKTTDPDAFLVYSGQLDPKLMLNVAPTFSYKSFSATASMLISLGSVKRLNPYFATTDGLQMVPSPHSNGNRLLLDRWRKPGDEQHTNIPVLTEQNDLSNQLIIPYIPLRGVFAGQSTDIREFRMLAYEKSDLMTVKNNYLRCNAFNLRYTVPGRKLAGTAVRGLSFGVSVNNLFTIANSKLNGQDPEIDGIGTTALPMTRQFAGVLNATF